MFGAAFGNGGNDTLIGGNNDDRLSGGSGDDNLLGNNANDSLFGDAGNDTLNGGTGSDLLVDSEGSNVIIGGAGFDTFDISSTLLGLYFDHARLTSEAPIQFADNEISQIEAIRFGAGNDTLFGTAAYNRIDAGRGDDYIDAGAGDDMLIGGFGSDVLVGGAGADTFFAGGNYEVGVAPVVDPSEVNYVYAGDGNDSIWDGGLGIDILLGGAGDDEIRDYYGSFTYLMSGTGNNTLFSAALVSVFISEGFSDTLSGSGFNFYYRLGDGRSTVSGGADVDQFIGGNALSNDVVAGNGGNDYLYGGVGNDVLSGGAGNDVILGQSGNDTLDGGAGVNLLWANDAGNDVVRVNVAQGGVQVVEFFEAGGTNDVMQLQGSNLTSFAGIQNLINNISTLQNGNFLTNAGSGAQLILGFGTATQTSIWFQGISAYNLTSADFLFG